MAAFWDNEKRKSALANATSGDPSHWHLQQPAMFKILMLNDGRLIIINTNATKDTDQWEPLLHKRTANDDDCSKGGEKCGWGRKMGSISCVKAEKAFKRDHHHWQRWDDRNKCDKNLSRMQWKQTNLRCIHFSISHTHSLSSSFKWQTDSVPKTSECSHARSQSLGNWPPRFVKMYAFVFGITDAVDAQHLMR